MIVKNLDKSRAPVRAVVLGAKGFVGSHLIAGLVSRGIETVGISSKEIDLTVQASVDQLASWLKPTDALILVSALTPDRGRDFGTVLSNLAMANHVALALKKSKVDHFIAVGSDAVFDDNASLITEATPRAPGTNHGIMHLAREIALSAACKEAQVPFAVVRPSAIYGPGDTHKGYGPNRFLISGIETGEISLFGNGEEKRDHVHIDDVVELISRCLHFKCSGNVNSVSGEAISFMDAAQEVRRQVAEKFKKEIAIKTSPRQNPVTHKHFDVSSLLAVFPELKMTQFSEGLKKTLANI